MDSAIFRVALLLGFGHTTLNSALEITASGNNGVGFTQGSEAILTCTISPYTGSQIWKVDGVSVADCGFVLCSKNASNPERYSFTPDISTGTFVFTINPVDSADNGNIDCFNGSSTETFIMVVTDPALMTDTGARFDEKKCVSLTTSVIILFLYGIAQSKCLGYIIYGICQKGGIKNIVSDNGFLVLAAIACVPGFGIITLVLLLLITGYWKERKKARKNYSLELVKLICILVFIPVVFIIPANINLYFYRKYWRNAKKPYFAASFIIFCCTVTPIALVLLECWDKVSQISPEYGIIAMSCIIFFAYFFVIWIAVLFELFLLQCFEALKFRAKGDLEPKQKFACMSCQLVDICTTCKMDLCEKSINRRKGHIHTPWNSLADALTCETCKKKAVKSARCVCLTCKRLMCAEHSSNKLCQYTPLWSKHTQENWECEICHNKDYISAKNICLECKTAFCTVCSCRCRRKKTHETRNELTQVTAEWTCEVYHHKKYMFEANACQKGCKIKFCEHLYPAVCLKCKTVLCLDCAYLHVMQCLEPTLIWRNPQALHCYKRNDKNEVEQHEPAENFCLDCNEALCRDCSRMHMTQCDRKGVKCNECGEVEAVCLGCRKNVCKRSSNKHFSNREEMFCADYSVKIHLHCYECKKATSTEAKCFCTYCRTFICISCSQSCSSHSDKVWKKSTEIRNFRCQPCECLVHGYCKTCRRTVCSPCFQRCQVTNHDLIKLKTIPASQIPLIASGCLLLFGLIALNKLRK